MTVSYNKALGTTTGTYHNWSLEHLIIMLLVIMQTQTTTMQTTAVLVITLYEQAQLEHDNGCSWYGSLRDNSSGYRNVGMQLVKMQ